MRLENVTKFDGVIGHRPSLLREFEQPSNCLPPGSNAVKDLP